MRITKFICFQSPLPLSHKEESQVLNTGPKWNHYGFMGTHVKVRAYRLQVQLRSYVFQSFIIILHFVQAFEAARACRRRLWVAEDQFECRSFGSRGNICIQIFHQQIILIKNTKFFLFYCNYISFLCSKYLVRFGKTYIYRNVIRKHHYMAHAKKKSATGTSAVGGRDTCNKLPCDRDDSLLLRYIKNLPTARESNPPLTFIQLQLK